MADTTEQDDTRPFPIQGSCGGIFRKVARCTIPWWLAKRAYAEYAHRHGREQSIERIAERGGFSREELIQFLRGHPEPPMMKTPEERA